MLVSSASIARGFVSVTRSGRRVGEPGRAGNCNCANGTVTLIVNSSTPEICFGEVDDFVAASAEYSLQHEKREALGHFHGDGRRHREFRPIHYGIDENRPVMRERG